MRIAGVQAGKELGKYYYNDELNAMDEGSCMIVVATDAPLKSRNLKSLAKRALLDQARTGDIMSNGSGDYVISFSTAESLQVPYRSDSATQTADLLRNEITSLLFMAVVEATEEAILNSLFNAETMTGRDGHTVEPLPLKKIIPLLENYSHIK